MSPTYEVAALCHPRSAWPLELARWATTGSAPVRLLSCVSADEVRSLLAAGHAPCAVLIDGSSSQVDEQLLGGIKGSGALVVGVECEQKPTPWESLGADRVLPAHFAVTDLLDVLTEAPRSDGNTRPGDPAVASGEHGGRRNRIIGVCGSPGAGTTVTSMAIASYLGAGPERMTGPASVLLLEATGRGHHGLYHDTGDVIPSMADVIEKARSRDLHPDDLRTMTFDVRGEYRLCLGAPGPVESNHVSDGDARLLLQTVTRHHGTTVVDHDGAGSGALAAAVAEAADLWVTVTTAGMKGLHDAARMVLEAISAGVAPQNQLVLLNMTSRRGASRLGIQRDLSRLLEPVAEVGVRVSAVPSVRMEPALRDGLALPRRFRTAVGEPVVSLLEGSTPARGTPQPDRSGRRVPLASTRGARVTTGAGSARMEFT